MDTKGLWSLLTRLIKGYKSFVVQRVNNVSWKIFICAEFSDISTHLLIYERENIHLCRMYKPLIWKDIQSYWKWNFWKVPVCLPLILDFKFFVENMGIVWAFSKLFPLDAPKKYQKWDFFELSSSCYPK